MTQEDDTPSSRGPAPEPSATEALAAIHAARAGLPGPPEPHAGFDLLYGTACALLVAAQGLAPPWSMLLLALGMAGLALMIYGWRRRFGWWINGYSPRRARWVAYGMGAVLLALVAASAYGRQHGPWWLFLAAGGAGFVAAILGSRLWMRVWRAELAEGVR